jgi:hypothetical protein
LRRAFREPVEGTAALDLQTLCETVVTQTAATSLSDFVTEQLPAPRGARVLGCILQLADAGDGARFWWQYAAGAGDDAASYCLYLHHLSFGETYAATWWRQQTRIDTRPAPEAFPLPCGPHHEEQAEDLALDSSTPTVLRVLSRLLSTTGRHRNELVNAVMDYVPGAVAAGYVSNPDIEIPLPGPDFAEHIAVILAAASADTAAVHRRQDGAPPRPLRRRRRLSGTVPLSEPTDHVRVNSPGPEQAVRGGLR